MLGHDFTAFYAAGHFVATGQADKLYDIEAVKHYEQETGRRYGLSLGDSYGPYWNPPFYALIFAPLARLPYPRALAIWTVINIACGIGASILLMRFLPRDATWRMRALIPAGILTSMPLLQCLSHGQNTLTSLLILTIAVTFWRSARPYLAGVATGLLLYKPQLGAIVAAALVINQGPRALLGLMTTGAVLLAITVIALPGTLGAFLHQLPANVRFMQVDHAYVWERHATLKAFFRLWFQGRGAGEATLLVTVLATGTSAALGGYLLWTLLRGGSATSSRRTTPDAMIAATIATMPLLMPFYFDYDLLLLAVPITLFAGANLNSQFPNLRSLTAAFLALYLWSEINPGVAGSTRVNLNVPLLFVVATLLISWAKRQTAATNSGLLADEPITLPPRAQAA
jgi:hypothetical protein